MQTIKQFCELIQEDIDRIISLSAAYNSASSVGSDSKPGKNGKNGNPQAEGMDGNPVKHAMSNPSAYAESLKTPNLSSNASIPKSGVQQVFRLPNGQLLHTSPGMSNSFKFLPKTPS